MSKSKLHDNIVIFLQFAHKKTCHHALMHNSTPQEAKMDVSRLRYFVFVV